jgi:hypothetical protein
MAGAPRIPERRLHRMTAIQPEPAAAGGR